MLTFEEAVFYILGEGQALTGAEKMLVRDEIKRFIDEFEGALGRPPTSLFGDISYFAPRLERFGFVLPSVERWRREDLNAYFCRLKGRGFERR